MTTQEIASRLYELCSQGQYDQAQKELYALDAISMEPTHAQGMQTVQGIENIIKKGDEFMASVEEMHGGSVGQPIVAGNHIAMTISIDATYKGMGRMAMEEIAVYEVKDGKIVKEQFFY